MKILSKSCNCKNKKEVKGSLVFIEDGTQSEEAEIPVEYVREALYELADLYGYESVFEDIINWFSSWELRPVVEDIMADANMTWRED